MQTLSTKIDQRLIDLAWSLWTELGVAGIERRHQRCLIAPEELILLTAVIADSDPRLRDEALDWCSRYHHLISISRLRTLAKAFGPFIDEPFSKFAATLNSVSKANWPLYTTATPLKFVPSGKSKSPPCELPALLYLRLRSLFGVGARADLMTFFLTQMKSDFTAADTAEIGYSKSSLAALLDSFVQSGLFDAFATRNQRSYCFIKRDQMMKILDPLPEVAPSWRHILEVVLPLRECVQRIENKSGGVKIVEARTTLASIESKLRKLNLTAPPFDADFLVYWDRFSGWILGILQSFARGDFEQNEERAKMLSWEEKRDAAKRIGIQFKGLFLNVASLSTQSSEQTRHFLFENYKDAFRKHLNVYLPKIHTDDQKKIRALADKLLSVEKTKFTASLKEEFIVQVDQILEKYF